MPADVSVSHRKWCRASSPAANRRSAHATETTEDDPAIGARDLLSRGFTGKDVLVGIAASGRTPYVLGAVAEAGAGWGR